MNSTIINNTPDNNKVITNNGSSVKVSFGPPIQLDSKKKYQLRLLSSNITNCNPNITSANNKFSYKYNGLIYDKEIPIGLWSLDEINYIIGMYTTAQNGLQLFAFTGNNFNSTINVTFLTANTFIYLTQNSIMSILGFSTTSTSGYSDYIGGFMNGGRTAVCTGDQPARLDKTSLILVKCNITNGSYLNSQANNIIASIPINAAASSQIQTNPVHPCRNNIILDRIDNLQIDLLDQDGNSLDFMRSGTALIPEKWNVTLDINEYDIKSIL